MMFSVDSDVDASDSSSDSDSSTNDSHIPSFSFQANKTAVRRSSSVLSVSALEVKAGASSIVQRSSSGIYAAENITHGLSTPVSHASTLKRKADDRASVSEVPKQNKTSDNKKVLTSIMRLYRSTCELKTLLYKSNSKLLLF